MAAALDAFTFSQLDQRAESQRFMKLGTRKMIQSGVVLIEPRMMPI